MADSIEEQLNGERRRVDVDSNNFPVRELVRMMNDGELDIAPAYQRKFRWNTEIESTFIESLFLGLPVPSLFVATNEGFTWEVVDGLQRLSTLLHFLDPSAEALARINRQAPLTLSGLEKVTELNGRTFRTLPQPLQIYFGRQPLQVTALTDKSDLDVRFDLFERLNGGSVILSPQEVRSCVYRGNFSDFLEKLSANEKFTALLKLQPAKQNDGTAEEIVLKFFAYLNHRDAFAGRVTEFLNHYMSTANESFDEDAGEELFDKVVNELYRITGGEPYLRSDYGVTPLVQLEATLVGLGELVKQGEAIGTPSPEWVDDEELKQSSMGGTNTRAMLQRRVTRAKELLGA